MVRIAIRIVNAKIWRTVIMLMARVLAHLGILTLTVHQNVLTTFMVMAVHYLAIVRMERVVIM